MTFILSAKSAFPPGLINWLCTDPEAAALSRPKGLRVVGAKVEGQLDLAYSTIAMPLSFSRCVFTEPIFLFQEIPMKARVDHSKT